MVSLKTEFPLLKLLMPQPQLQTLERLLKHQLLKFMGSAPVSPWPFPQILAPLIQPSA